MMRKYFWPSTGSMNADLTPNIEGTLRMDFHQDAGHIFTHPILFGRDLQTGFYITSPYLSPQSLLQSAAWVWLRYG